MCETSPNLGVIERRIEVDAVPSLRRRVGNLARQHDAVGFEAMSDLDAIDVCFDPSERMTAKLSGTEVLEGVLRTHTIDPCFIMRSKLRSG